MNEEPIFSDFRILREDDEKAVAEATYIKGGKLTMHIYKGEFDKLLVSNGKGLVLDTEFIKLRYGKDIK